MGYIIVLAFVALVIIGVVKAIKNQKANNTALGGTASTVQRILSVNYLGGHPQHPDPVRQCNLVFSATEVAIEKGAGLLFRMPIGQIMGLHVETEDEAKRRITATRMLTTGVFALAIPKKTLGSVLINHDTAIGPMAFEKTKTSKVAMTQTLGRQIAKVNAGKPSPAAAERVALPARHDIADELQKLAQLKTAGILSDADFDK